MSRDTPLTPATSDVGYCTPAEALRHHDARQWGDLVSDADSRADAGALASDPTMAALLLRASGEVESACFAGSRYRAIDLKALLDGGGAGSELLRGLVADLAFWAAKKRRHPGVTPEQVPGAAAALESLRGLRLGERVFPFAESAAAGLSSRVPTFRGGGPGRTVGRARRYFGRRGRDGYRGACDAAGD